MAAQVIRLKRPPYTKSVSEFLKVHARHVGPIASMIYLVLRDHEDWETRECYPSIPTIARQVGVSVSTVQRHLPKLVEAGLIDIEARRDAAGDPTTYNFRVLDPSPDAVAKRRQERERQAQGGGRTEQPPWSQSATTPGSSVLPEQDLSLEQQLENRESSAYTAENREETPPATRVEMPPSAQANPAPCAHPATARRRFDLVQVCTHCWDWWDNAGPIPAPASKGEEDQAHAGCAA